jgi:fatty-acyl-CoA synthase
MAPDTTDEVAWDAQQSGARAPGPWIASTYYNDERAAKDSRPTAGCAPVTCTIDADGYVRLVDRTQDLIRRRVDHRSRSRVVMAPPKVAEAAVVGVPRPRVGERRWRAWWEARRGSPRRRSSVPGAEGHGDCPTTVFIDEVPRRASASSARDLRSRFADYVLPDA